MKNRTLRLLPLIGFLLLALVLWRGLALDPHNIPSQLINKPAPALDLPELHHQGMLLQTSSMLGHYYLLHVWATWCNTCQNEHPMLMDLAQQGVPIYGVAYKDKADDALKWLSLYGNPYKKVAFDAAGTVAINWGVYGTPETFLVDKQGIIRYKQIGVLTHDIWQKKFLPLVKKYS